MPNTATDSIVPNLARLREAKGMTQAQLGAAVGVTAVMIAHYESGRNNPSSARLMRLARELSVTVEKLAR